MAYYEGLRAAADGLSRWANPYPMRSTNNQLWDNGWCAYVDRLSA